MNCVIGFHRGDKAQAIRLAEWVRDLGGVKKHKCLLVVAANTDESGVIEPLREAFESAEVAFKLAEECEHPEWPHMANMMWSEFAIWMPRQKEHFAPWLWLEPDAVPLITEWLDKIEEAYNACGMPLMGDFVKVDDISIHISGVAVYPARVGQLTNKLWEIHPLGVPLNKRAPAWDMALREDFFPFAANTPLIHHCFWQHKKPDIAPTFPTQESLSFIESEAVLFHRCKDSSLIDRLREKRSPKQISVSRNGEQREAATAGATSAHETLGHRIFTYYAEVPKINRVDEFELIDLWKTEWRKAGWEPHVLGERDAEKHPWYKRARSIFEKFPSQNPAGYDLICFMRWIAISVQGGGWMADYDVIPLHPAFSEESNGLDFFSGNERDPLIPCLVHGTQEMFEDVILHFMTTPPTGELGQHWSDMLALRNYRSNRILGNNDVIEYGESGWQNAKAVHFPTARMQPAGLMPKWKHIPKLLGEARIKMASDLMDRIQSPNGTNSKSDTIISQIRDHLGSISTLIDGKHHRRQIFQQELRKAGLFGQPRKSNGPKRRNSAAANQAAPRKHKGSASVL